MFTKTSLHRGCQTFSPAISPISQSWHTWKYEHCLNKWCYEALFYWSYELRPEGVRCFTTHLWAPSESRGKKRAWRCKLKLSMRWNFSFTCSTFCYSNGSRPFLVSGRINHWFWDNILLLQMFFSFSVFSPSCHILLSHWVIDHQEVNQCRPLHHKLFSARTEGQSLAESTKFSYLHWTVSPLMWVPCGLNLHNAVI